MKTLQFPLTRITLFFIAGILFAFYLKPNLNPIFLCLGLVFLCFVVSYFLSGTKSKSQFSFVLLSYLLSFTVGITTLQVHNDYYDSQNYIHAVTHPDDSYFLAVTLREKLKATPFNDRYIAEVNAIDGKKASGKLLVNIRKDSLEKKRFIGSRFLLYEKVHKHKSPFNPNQFDYGKYLENKSILAQVYINTKNLKERKEVDESIWFYSAKIRDRIIENLEKSNFNKTELSVVIALILGQQQDISPEIMMDYQFAGAVHILSVSGLHVGYIMLFLNFLLSGMPKTQKGNLLKLLIIIFSLWSFAVIAGLSPSIVRSVTMFSFVAIGIHSLRKTNNFHTLIVSMLLILLFEPSFLFDVGFQLSYMALFFILWFQPILSRLWKPKNKVNKYFWDILTVSFAAQIGTLPLSLYYFHQFPGLFFITNLVILPALGIIMALGLVVMIWALFGLVPLVLVKPLEFSIWCLNGVINWIASFEQFVFKNIPFNIYMELSLYGLIITSIFLFEKRNYKRTVLVLGSVFLFQFSVLGTQYYNQNQQEWLVFHSKKSSLFVKREGTKINVYASDSLLEHLAAHKAFQSYLTANFSDTIEKNPISNLFYFKGNKILVVDSLALYSKNIKPDVLILTASPQLNLERLLNYHKPNMVVADGSNYRSYVERWKRTCEKQKIPFHATGEKGFYSIK
ncbi:ComEC/Rec2 family competence protein [Flavobacterium sp.]|uniref:ComEC/Rec2 family competence protein n=1 Tax=Flavobacterium sp. TaxID=239 RepID=UPI0026067257|nr:ComEC/Rec2 family competence protein [Flavobacterium sp.]MDD3005515.1 ComEC/Rec2 family competence protein [Flavobacterium sp.]